MLQKKKKVELLSVIVPAYKQERTIKKDIFQLQKTIQTLKIPYEIIVVVDGDVDKTIKKLKEIKSKRIISIGYPSNRGKGHAVRYGMARAKGNIIAFIDAGMDLKPTSLSMLMEHFRWYGADIIVGSKLHPVSKVNYPFIRRIFSWGYRFLVKILFGLSIRDTQVGAKIYKRKVLDKVLPRLLVKNYAFDIEILAIAQHLGFRRIYEAPVEIRFNKSSTITSKNFWRVIYLMLWDTIAVFYRLKIRHYYDDANKRSWKFDQELNYKVNLP